MFFRIYFMLIFQLNLCAGYDVTDTPQLVQISAITRGKKSFYWFPQEQKVPRDLHPVLPQEEYSQDGLEGAQGLLEDFDHQDAEYQ